MDLFNDAFDAQLNLLPHDGQVYYHGSIMPPEQADAYFAALQQDLAWQHDQAVIMGRVIETARQVAWYGDARFAYTYSGVTKYALPWTAELLALKALAEQRTGARFNSCLANLYENGTQGMAWHSDDEAALARGAPIASLSFGAERKFGFKHKTDGATVWLTLAHGSLLVMAGATQTHWRHRLPPTTKITMSRVNLTFRTMVSTSEAAAHPTPCD
ncbi:MAG: alpha-ketoglutarate-dependent dioxygenase AlkB family protein [Formosimonas sp.]